MRLGTEEVKMISQEIRQVDPEAQIFLYGSRTDDAARGGDIDLWVRSSRITYRDSLRLLSRLKNRIGWQKIDLTVNAGEEDVLAQLVAEKGVPL